MSLALEATAVMVVLGAAGLAPTWWLVGRSWTVLPLSVLAGAVLSAVATTCWLAFGATMTGWFVGLAAAGTATSVVAQLRRGAPRQLGPPARRTPAVLTAVSLLAVTAWCLRGLATPTIGLDARLIWLPRAGWWLWSQHAALVQMRTIGGATHAGYPPLVSSTVAVAWWVTGSHSERLAVVVVALAGACAAVVAAWSVVELGLSMRSERGLEPDDHRSPAPVALPAPDALPARRGRFARLALPVVSAVVAVMLVLTYFGVTEPFSTNGYADPLWAVAAVGAVAYQLQAPSPARLGSAVILLAVAGESKTEGTATAVALVILIGVRHWWRSSTRSSPWRVLAAVVSSIAALSVWPLLMRWRHTGADVNTSGPRRSTLWSRGQAVYHAMAPHLDIVLAALLVSLLWLAAKVITKGAPHRMPSTLWPWAALAAGLGAVVGAYVVGPGRLWYLDLWLYTSAHRVAEYPELQAGWIVGVITVAGSVMVADMVTNHRSSRSPDRTAHPAGHPPEPQASEIGG